MRVSPMIWGEYDEVTMWSDHQDDLRLAHSTPCTPYEATTMLRELAREFAVPGLKVHFRGKRGRASRWADGRRLISLPITPMVPGEPYTHGRLRVGLVLHELAHLIAPPGSKHGPAFVRALDKLVMAWAATHHHTNAALLEVFNGAK